MPDKPTTDRPERPKLEPLSDESAAGEWKRYALSLESRLEQMEKDQKEYRKAYSDEWAVTLRDLNEALSTTEARLKKYEYGGMEELLKKLESYVKRTAEWRGYSDEDELIHGWKLASELGISEEPNG